MKRQVYLGLALVLAAAAALLSLRAQHTTPVVFATHDLSAGSQIQSVDLEIRDIHDDGVPAGALTDLAAANGLYAVLPLTAGEPVLQRAVSSHRSGGSLSAEFSIPAGYVAISVPVQPAAAVGGILQPGDRVDVYATPLAVAQGTGVNAETLSSGSMPASAQLIGSNVLVIELRSDQGQSMQPPDSSSSVHGLSFGVGKLGSVVLAVPAGDVAKYAAATTSDSIYLAMSIS